MGVEESTGRSRVCLSGATPFRGQTDKVSSIRALCRRTTYGSVVFLGNARAYASFDCCLSGAPGGSPGRNVLRLRSVGGRRPYM